jgi:hypothetical protein
LFRLFDNGYERRVFIRSEARDHVTIAGISILAPAGVANHVAKPVNVGKADTGASRIDAAVSLPV